MRDVERNCRTFEPFVSPYTPSNANRDIASKAFDRFGRTFEPFISPYILPDASRDAAPKAFAAFGRAEDALKLPDESSVHQGSSVSDVSHAFPRPKKRRIEAVLSTAVSVVVITSVMFMAVVLSPQNKSAATHDVMDAARLDAHRFGLGPRNGTEAENTSVETIDGSAVGADESIPSLVRTKSEKSADQISSTEYISYWMTVSAAISTEAEIRRQPMQRKQEDKLQSAIRELLIRSANATSHRDAGISTQ